MLYNIIFTNVTKYIQSTKITDVNHLKINNYTLLTHKVKYIN
jgi:hypothetical protein